MMSCPLEVLSGFALEWSTHGEAAASFVRWGVTRFQLQNAVGEDIDHIGVREPLLEGLGAVIEVHVPMNVVGRTPLLEKTAEGFKTTMRWIGPVVDIARRCVTDE